MSISTRKRPPDRVGHGCVHSQIQTETMIAHGPPRKINVLSYTPKALSPCERSKKKMFQTATELTAHMPNARPFFHLRNYSYQPAHPSKQQLRLRAEKVASRLIERKHRKTMIVHGLPRKANNLYSRLGERLVGLRALTASRLGKP